MIKGDPTDPNIVYVGGDRQDTPFRRWQSRQANRNRTWITQETVQDSASSLKIYRAHAIKGLKLVTADPRRIDLVEFATLHLRQRPGTDVALVNGLMHIIIERGWHDRAYIEARTEGFDALQAAVSSYTPQRVSQITGVPAAELEQCAELLARGKPMAVVWAMGITQHTTGVLNVLSLGNLQMLLGNMGVPGGGVNVQRNEWRKLKGQYLFNGRALGLAFRGAFLRALSAASLSIPATPEKWIAQCEKVGRGLQALQYLSRYLYRGVISNHNIIEDDGANVTFRYRDGQTQTIQTRTLPGEDFMALLLQHVLPKGLRRARDYGFLHGNAKRILKIVQWVLRVPLPAKDEKHRAQFRCPHCHGRMFVIRMTPPRFPSG